MPKRKIFECLTSHIAKIGCSAGAGPVMPESQNETLILQKPPRPWSKQNRLDWCRRLGQITKLLAQNRALTWDHVSVISEDSDAKPQRKRFKNMNAYRENGRRTGLINATNGHLDRIRTYESAALGARVVCHLRWHVSRGIENPKCCFCAGEELP